VILVPVKVLEPMGKDAPVKNLASVVESGTPAVQSVLSSKAPEALPVHLVVWLKAINGKKARAKTIPPRKCFISSASY
jgi:hypothetical protein